jgi:TPP-dependent pyruvate/acetoin dehydrogenase alpha subunit
MTKDDLIAFEQQVALRYDAGEIHAPIHLSGGNEDQLIEIFKGISRDDLVLSTWRSHLHALLHGVAPDELMRQILFGRSMYINSLQPWFYASSIAGGILPIAVGLGMAIKRKGEARRVFVFCGDMAAEMGVFHEATKYAENFDLPVEFIIEDNGASVLTQTEDAWGCINYVRTEGPHIRRYKYKLSWPHHGTGKEQKAF